MPDPSTSSGSRRAESRRDWAQHVRRRLSPLRLSPTRENEIVDELSQHLDDRWRELIASGASPDEATQLALADFRDGNLLAWHMAPLRQAQTPPSILPGAPTGHVLNELLADIRYALRGLRRGPGFAAIAILSIGLGIGANTAIFSIVNAVMVRPLPYAEPERLVGIWGTHVRAGGRRFLSPAAFLDVKSQTGTLEQTEAVEYVTFNLVTAAEPMRVSGARASAGIFSLLGVGALQGRTFLENEDRFGSRPVAVLSHGLLQRQFGSDPRWIGRSVTLNGVAHTVIGVIPATLQFPLNGPDVWVPFAMSPEERAVRHTSNFQVFGRLKRGLSADHAQAELTSMARREEHKHPHYQNWASNVIPLSQQMVSDVRQALLLLLAAVGLVLLIACANIGNLLLARSTVRQQEISVRIALGARRSRLVRQLLTESLVLAAGGSVVGVALAHSGVQALRLVIPAAVLQRSRGDFAIDGSVLAFSLAISLLAAVLFGLGPAMRLSSVDLNTSFKGAARSVTGSHRDRRLRAALVVLETALAVVLLIGAGLLINSFWRLQRVDPGFRTERLLTLRIALPESEYRDRLVPSEDTFIWEGRQVQQFFDALLQRLGTLPGVIAVAASGYAPLTGENNSATFEKEHARWMGSGQPPEGVQSAFFRPISANYFRALGIPLLRGRELNEHDTQEAPPVAVINETMARQFWPGEDPLGQRFRTSTKQPWRAIVGVVGDVRYRGFGEPPIPEMYFAYAQALWPQHSMTVVVRAGIHPTDLVGAIRREVSSLDPNLPIYDVRTMEQLVQNSLAGPRFNVILLGTFAGLALILAAVGIYGVVSYSVTQRTHELGLRIAIGAQPRDVVAMVLRESLAVVALGMAVGIGAALLGTRALSGLLFGVSRTDPGTWIAVASLLFAVAFLASYVPARRATRVDPMMALRGE